MKEKNMFFSYNILVKKSFFVCLFVLFWFFFFVCVYLTFVSFDLSLQQLIFCF